MRPPARLLQLDVQGADGRARVDRRERDPLGRLRAHAHELERPDHARRRPRRVAGGHPADRVRGARPGLHPEAHRDIPAHGRQPEPSRRQGGRVPPRVLRRVPVPHTEQLRPDGVDLRGLRARHRPSRGALRRRRRARPARGVSRHHRRRHPVAHRHARREPHQLGRGAGSLRRRPRGLLGPRAPALHHGRVRPDPAGVPRHGRHASDRPRLPEELRGGLHRRRHHPRAAHIVPARARRAHRGEPRDGHPRGRNSQRAHLRAAVPGHVRAANPGPREERLLGARHRERLLTEKRGRGRSP